MSDGKPTSFHDQHYDEIMRRLATLHELVEQIEDMAAHVFPVPTDGPGLPQEVTQFQTRKLVVETERYVRHAIEELFGPQSAESRNHRHLGLSTRAQVAATIDALEELLFQLELKKHEVEDSEKRDSPPLCEPDPLADLYGRRHFERSLSYELNRSQRFGYTCTLGLFAVSNSSAALIYDPSMADQLLVTLTCACKASLRGYDQVCRVADTDLAVMLPQSDSWETDSVCRRIIKRFDLVQRQRELRVTVEVGLATFPFDAETSAALFKTARARRICFI